MFDALQFYHLFIQLKFVIDVVLMLKASNIVICKSDFGSYFYSAAAEDYV